MDARTGVKNTRSHATTAPKHTSYTQRQLSQLSLDLRKALLIPECLERAQQRLAWSSRPQSLIEATRNSLTTRKRHHKLHPSRVESPSFNMLRLRRLCRRVLQVKHVHSVSQSARILWSPQKTPRQSLRDQRRSALRANTPIRRSMLIYLPWWTSWSQT